jgi:hypothetical protein
MLLEAGFEIGRSRLELGKVLLLLGKHGQHGANKLPHDRWGAAHSTAVIPVCPGITLAALFCLIWVLARTITEHLRAGAHVVELPSFVVQAIGPEGVPASRM